MTMTRTLLAAVAATGFAGAASANITVEVLNVGSPVAGFTAYDIVLTNSQGNITGVDAFNNGGGFFGPMRQSWIPGTFGDTPSPTLSALSAGPDSFNNGDSHFNFEDDAFIATPDALTENNDGQFGTNTTLDGLGDFLTGSFALDPAEQASTIVLAHIVIPDGENVSYNFSVAGEGLQDARVQGQVIPEPGSLALLGLGGLALLRRRR